MEPQTSPVMDSQTVMDTTQTVMEPHALSVMEPQTSPATLSAPDTSPRRPTTLEPIVSATPIEPLSLDAATLSPLDTGAVSSAGAEAMSSDDPGAVPSADTRAVLSTDPGAVQSSVSPLDADADVSIRELYLRTKPPDVRRRWDAQTAASLARAGRSLQRTPDNAAAACAPAKRFRIRGKSPATMKASPLGTTCRTVIPRCSAI